MSLNDAVFTFYYYYYYYYYFGIKRKNEKSVKKRRRKHLGERTPLPEIKNKEILRETQIPNLENLGKRMNWSFHGLSLT